MSLVPKGCWHSRFFAILPVSRSDSRFAKVRMHQAAFAIPARSRNLAIIRGFPHLHRSSANGTIDAVSPTEQRKREKEIRGYRGFDSDVYFGFDSRRRGCRAVRIDLQSAAGRPDGHVRTAVRMRDRVPAGEREKSSDALDRYSVAARKPRGGVGASGFTAASARGYTTGRRRKWLIQFQCFCSVS